MKFWANMLFSFTLLQGYAQAQDSGADLIMSITWASIRHIAALEACGKVYDAKVSEDTLFRFFNNTLNDEQISAASEMVESNKSVYYLLYMGCNAEALSSINPEIFEKLNVINEEFESKRKSTE